MAPVHTDWVHILCLPLVLPKKLADNPDLWIGPTKLIVADVVDHQSVWTDRGAGVTEQAGLPRVESGPGCVEPYAVWPAVTQELPGAEFLRVERVVEVYDV